MKNLYKVISLTLILITLAVFTPSAIAQTMSNDDFIIRMGNLNMSSGKPTGSGYQLGFTAGQTGPGLYSLEGVNYKVRAGFQYISSIVPFSFAISNTSIDFGILSPTNPVTRTTLLTVSNQSSGGYTVTAQENHQLMVPSSGALIPDTTCDSGTCTQTTASTWSNSLTYGFGYRCGNVDPTNYCVADFSDSTFYKQFSDISKSESAQVVMQSSNAGRNQKAEVTFKLNISGSQVAGQYSNIVTFIATPTF